MDKIESTFKKSGHVIGAFSAARMRRFVLAAAMAMSFILASPMASSAGYVVDTTASPSSLTGLWGNDNESGWGATLTQQYDVIFVTIYTYDGAGNPVWYVASNCAVSGAGCQGDLYKVNGGSMPTVTWNGSNKVVTAAGTVNLVLTSNDTGTMSYTINGASGSKAITRSVFRTGPSGGSTGSTQTQVAATCTSNNFTQAHYNQIALGMTLSQVNATIGCANSITLTQYYQTVVVYGWRDVTANMFIYVYFDSTGSVVTPISTASQTFKDGFGF